MCGVALNIGILASVFPTVGGKSSKGIKKEYKLPDSIISTWVKQYGNSGTFSIKANLTQADVEIRMLKKEKSAETVKADFFLVKADLRNIDIFHTDRGSEFKNNVVEGILDAFQIKSSLSAKGSPIDNAVIQNFFGLLNSQLLYLQKFDSIDHLRAALEDYMDYYNNHRMKLKLKGLTPAKHRSQAFLVA